MKPGHRTTLVALAAFCLGASGAAWSQEALPFGACIDALKRERALQRPPVSVETFERFTRDAQDMRAAIRAASESQPEFKLPIWDYIARLVDRQRVDDGRKVLATQALSLRTIASRHGVDAATVAAVFGVETDYGRIEGKHRVIDATLSRACLDLQSKERKRHFFAALWLLQEGLVTPDNFRGSWAGAFGLTQFMPGTFIAAMDDGDGSGRVDIVGSAPDALATTARYIASLDWTDGLRWGVEARLPPNASTEWIASEREHACLSNDSGRAGKCKSIEEWAALGVMPARALTTDEWPKGTHAALLAPAGERGPAWLVTRNYQAIWQYNRADAYGLAIGLLADALRNDPPLLTEWPTSDPGLSRAEMLALQRRLAARGHDVVADGYDGPRTREAIRVEERARGWDETGRAGARIARTLAEADDSRTGSGGAASAPAMRERPASSSAAGSAAEAPAAGR